MSRDILFLNILNTILKSKEVFSQDYSTKTLYHFMNHFIQKYIDQFLVNKLIHPSDLEKLPRSRTRNRIQI